MLKKIILVSLYSVSLHSLATENNNTSNRLTVGLGTVVSSGVYLGEKTQVTPIPAINYQGEHFFIRGLYAGTDLYKYDAFTLNAIASVNLMHLDVDKLKENKLASHHLSKSQLEDRDRSLDLGLEGLLRLPYGVVSIQAVNDIAGASKAAEFRTNYQYLWRINNNLSLVPNAGFTWMTDKRANYYYGILDAEVERGVPNYKPGNVFIPHISLGANYVFNDKISLTGALSNKFLPHKVKDSPIVDKTSLTNLVVALAYKF